MPACDAAGTLTFARGHRETEREAQEMKRLASLPHRLLAAPPPSCDKSTELLTFHRFPNINPPGFWLERGGGGGGGGGGSRVFVPYNTDEFSAWPRAPFSCPCSVI
ncbi:hypothetical protein JOB18_018481 [Solea senegalensis]|uniref:Uncharacterized protein n=1 Tax=Solea senegalensis TaxID=28829 RepID=A0AAV6PM28_SOLSE|nr:hypothetical protein JOB18_018481 [Solea senegalensis]